MLLALHAGVALAEEPAAEPADEPAVAARPGDEAAMPTEEGPLQRAIEGMRSAQQRIAGRDTGEATRDIQSQVVKDLEALIEQVQQSPPPSSNPPRDPSQQNSQRRSPQDGNQAGHQSETANSGESANASSSTDDAQESTGDTREASRRAAEQASRQQMVRDVWGHLPPAMRQKLLNVFGEKYLPKYRDEVERYFESLAEEGRSNQ